MRSPESRKIENVRPIQNLPAGISTMPSGAAVCAAAGNTAQTQQRKGNISFFFIFLFFSGGDKTPPHLFFKKFSQKGEGKKTGAPRGAVFVGFCRRAPSG